MPVGRLQTPKDLTKRNLNLEPELTSPVLADLKFTPVPTVSTLPDAKLLPREDRTPPVHGAAGVSGVGPAVARRNTS